MTSGGCSNRSPAEPEDRRFASVVFDLDGTLVDSRPGIEASVSAALGSVAPDVGIPDIGALLGRSLEGLISAVGSGLTVDQRALAHDAFVRHYDSDGWRGSAPYPGVTTALQRLRRSGIRLFVATNKRRRPTDLILAEVGLTGMLEGVYTPDSVEPAWTSKAEMAANCVRHHSLDPTRTLVVGDSRDDQEMAAANGLSFAAAAWGYGDAVSGILETGVAEAGYLRNQGQRPIQTVLESISDLALFVLPDRGAGRGL